MDGLSAREVVMDWGRVVEVLHYDDVMNGALPSAQP